MIHNIYNSALLPGVNLSFGSTYLPHLGTIQSMMSPTMPFHAVLNQKMLTTLPNMLTTLPNFQMGAVHGTALSIQDYFKNPVRVRNVTRKETIQTPEPTETKSEAPSNARISPEMKCAIGEAAKRYNVPEPLIESVIKAESNFNPKAVSRAGALGLMQLMPFTAKDMGVNDPMNINQNIDGGVKYLRMMMDKFDQNVKLALAAYNAGPGAVQRYSGIPPYEETQNYVAKIMKDYQSKV